MSTAAQRMNGVQFGAGDQSTYAAAYGAVGDGTANDAAAIQTALNAITQGGSCYLSASAHSYNLGTTGLTIPTGVRLVSAARQGAILKYSGTGAAIKLDSTIAAGLKNLNIQVNSSSATARGIAFANTTGNCQWNWLENVIVLQTNSGTPIAGQVGIDFVYTGSGNSLYWNELHHIHLGTWDKSIRMLGSVGLANGPNGNTFVDVMSYQANYGVSLEAYATENNFYGFFASASGYGGTAAVKIGDGTNPTNFNMFFGITSDQGVGPVTYQIAANAVGNVLLCNSQSSGAGTDAGTNSWITDALTGITKMAGLLTPQIQSPTPTFNMANGTETGVNIGGNNNLTSGLNLQIGTGGLINLKWNNVVLMSFNSTPTLFPATDGTGNVGLTNFRMATVNAKAIQGNGFYGLGSAPSGSVSGAAAQLGTTPSISIAGNDCYGVLTLTPGTTPSAFVAATTYAVATITFAVGKNSVPRYIDIRPADDNSASAMLGANGIMFFSPNSTPNTSVQWFLKMRSNGTPTLAAGTPLVFYYSIGL